MLPVRIDHAYEHPPWATLGLIAANVLAYVLAIQSAPDDVASLVLSTDEFHLYQLISSCFLHLGLAHLAVNMLFLWVFGRYVEARIGWWQLLVLYGLCGIGGGLAFLVESLGYDGARAVLGASGAIAGLMGFTLVAAPKAEIRMFLVWWAHRDGSELPAISAWFVLGAWILWQLLLWVAAGPYLGTAFSAHFGGLLTGAGLAFLAHSRFAAGTPWHLERAVAGGSYEGAKLDRTARRWRRRRQETRESEEAQEEARRETKARPPTHPDVDPIDWPLSTPEDDTSS